MAAAAKTLIFRSNTHRRSLCLDGQDLNLVPASSGGAVGLRPAIRASWTMSGIHLCPTVTLWWRQPRWCVATLLLGDVGVGAVDCLHVLPQGTRVGVALGAARDLTDVRFLWRRSERRR